jgi:glutamate-1-semialdehyde aminotransferase
MYGVKADLASYGKVIGGGLPFGIIAGQGRFMDVFDGGFWNYGDNSIPQVGVTYYAGTFTRHPLALAAAKAVLERLKKEGPALQKKLNATADDFAAELNSHFQSVGVSMHMANCGSMMNLTFKEEEPFGELLYILLRLKGVHIWDARPSFINLAHTPEDIEFVIEAFKSAIAELHAADLLSCNKPVNTEGVAPVRNRVQEISGADRGQQPPVPGARLGRDPHGNPMAYR